MTFALAMCVLLLLVNLSQPSTLHRCQDMVSKNFGARTLTFWRHVTSSVTWPLDSRYLVSCKWSFELTVYLARLSRYWASKISGSWFWPFGATWHWSRDPWSRNIWFPLGGQFKPTICLACFPRYEASKILGSGRWPFPVTWRHQSRNHWTRNM